MKNKKKVLVADDDPGILEVFTLMLEDEGYDVKTADNIETKNTAQIYQPDLILLDIWMAGIDGRIICKSLKRQKLTKHIPIIMVSANKDAKKYAKEAGADDFIAKPFEMDEFLAKVAKYTSTSK